MKTLVVLILTLLSTVAYAQQDSVRTLEVAEPDSVCFSTEQTKRIFIEIKRMETELIYADEVLKEYEKQFRRYEELLAMDSIRVYNLNQKIKLLEINNELLQQQLQLVKPKWYENPYLNFAAGVILTSAIVIGI